MRSLIQDIYAEPAEEPESDVYDPKEMLPCPGCEAEPKVLTDDYTFIVVCPECGRRTIRYPFEDLAIAQWNVGATFMPTFDGAKEFHEKGCYKAASVQEKEPEPIGRSQKRSLLQRILG